MDRNNDTWCYEVGTIYEHVNIKSVNDFDMLRKHTSMYSPRRVVELGCGDGAAANEFFKLGYDYIGIDCNKEKLDKINGGQVFCQDMLEWLREQPDNSLPNVFAHHSLEHTVDVENILQEISRTLCYGGIYYAVTPAHDYLHSVHFIAFDSVDELLPPGLTLLTCGEQIRNEPEYFCGAVK